MLLNEFINLVADVAEEGLALCADYQVNKKRKACIERDLHKILDECVRRQRLHEFPNAPPQLIDLIRLDSQARRRPLLTFAEVVEAK